MAATIAAAIAVVAIAMVAVVAMVALAVLVVLSALVALILVLFAPKVLRGLCSAAREIGTRTGPTQARIEYGGRTRTSQGQEQPSRHPDDDRSDFHDDLPSRRWVP